MNTDQVEPVETPSPVVNVDAIDEVIYLHGERWGGFAKLMTPSMQARGGSLGVSWCRLPRGRTMCPFHHHQLEDEVFFVLSGSGLLRYGEELYPLRAGDCVSCPAGTQTAHQLANTGDEDLVYLAIGPHHPNEVCVYPDSGKVMVRSLERVGYLNQAPYLDGEPASPRIFELGA